MSFKLQTGGVEAACGDLGGDGVAFALAGVGGGEEGAVEPFFEDEDGAEVSAVVEAVGDYLEGGCCVNMSVSGRVWGARWWGRTSLEEGSFRCC